MLIEPELLTTGTWLVTGLIALVGLCYAAASAPWRAWLEDRERQWVWLGSLALLAVVWSMKAGLSPGLSVRFLLITTLALMHGWQLAVIGAALALAVLCVSGQAAWSSFGAEYFAILPFMSLGEGVVNGMIMAMAVVYRPKWVMSFDDRLYLARPADGD